jgi:hypothetical protein
MSNSIPGAKQQWQLLDDVGQVQALDLGKVVQQTHGLLAVAASDVEHVARLDRLADQRREPVNVRLPFLVAVLVGLHGGRLDPVVVTRPDVVGLQSEAPRSAACRWRHGRVAHVRRAVLLVLDVAQSVVTVATRGQHPNSVTGSSSRTLSTG